mgnify:CR=1 FL=1
MTKNIQQNSNKLILFRIIIILNIIILFLVYTDASKHSSNRFSTISVIMLKLFFWILICVIVSSILFLVLTIKSKDDDIRNIRDISSYLILSTVIISILITFIAIKWMGLPYNQLSNFIFGSLGFLFIMIPIVWYIWIFFNLKVSKILKILFRIVWIILLFIIISKFIINR